MSKPTVDKPLSGLLYELGRRLLGQDDALAADLIAAAHETLMKERAGRHELD